MADELYFDFSCYDSNTVELFPIGFDWLAEEVGRGDCTLALGGFGWPRHAPTVWFVVCGYSDKITESVHLAVCRNEKIAREVSEYIACKLEKSGVASRVGSNGG